MRWLAIVTALVAPSLASAQQYYHYYPSSPVQVPYSPPLNYGPGNHFPSPFHGYPGHPTSHFYYPYTYAPYSFYYNWPTHYTYRDSYNPYYRSAPKPPVEPPKKTDGPAEKKELEKK